MPPPTDVSSHWVPLQMYPVPAHHMDCDPVDAAQPANGSLQHRTGTFSAPQLEHQGLLSQSQPQLEHQGLSQPQLKHQGLLSLSQPQLEHQGLLSQSQRKHQCLLSQSQPQLDHQGLLSQPRPGAASQSQDPERVFYDVPSYDNTDAMKLGAHFDGRMRKWCGPHLHEWCFARRHSFFSMNGTQPSRMGCGCLARALMNAFLTEFQPAGSG